MVQVVNFLIIVAMFSLPLLAWSKILKWNRERNERLDQISKDLKEIKESIAETHE